jgi:hypothetical protein
VILVDEVDEAHPLIVSPHSWEVERVGSTLAEAMGPLLKSARTILFVDRYFDIRKERYKETLKAALDLVGASGTTGARCEIHFCDHDTRPPAEVIERDARRWLRGVLPAGISIVLFCWKELAGGADFHARYLLTDRGGMSVEAGFSAEGVRQKVQLALLDLSFCQEKLAAFARSSTKFSLVEPVLEIFADGNVRRV